jgi:DNA modification methylase
MRKSRPSHRLEIEYLPLSALKPNPDNPRRHGAKQIEKLTASIGRLGFNGPIVIDEENLILCGHGRYEAALKLQLEEIPCVRLRHLTAAQKTAFAIADNKLHDLSTFDPDALKAELEAIIALDFDIELTGFDTAEIDILVDPPTAKVSDPDDSFELPATDQVAVARPQDLWRLGRHRLYCGSALDARSYQALLGDERAQMVFTDPPYNCPINGHVSGLGRPKHPEFAMASGEMSEPEFEGFVRTYMRHAADFSTDGSIHFHFMDWRQIKLLLTVGAGVYSELKNLCVWNKTNAGMGSLYRSQHELVAVFKKGTARHCNNVELGKNGRYRTNVWTYAGANAFSRTRDADLTDHPTVKPVGLVADAVRDCSKRGDLILDPFMGSGTTILAAERTGRRAAGLELAPLYVDVAIRRWQAKTGEAAVLAEDGRTFIQVREERLLSEEAR